jgi:hypothetical protein
MDFGSAISAIKSEEKVQRSIWVTEGRNWLLMLTEGLTSVPAGSFTNAALAAIVADLPGGVVNVAPVLTLFVPGNGVHFGWVPEAVDVLATDWNVIT